MPHTRRGSHLHGGQPLGSVLRHRNGWPRGGAGLGNGKPVSVEAVQDDHVVRPQLNFFSREQRDPVVLEVY